jgi:hypothetical protein
MIGCSYYVLYREVLGLPFVLPSEHLDVPLGMHAFEGAYTVKW